ncbi:hypothetical protein FNV43_RR01577 [Rhamnella rubrinervis]|uniref:Uncharacterized protein n=1 Tax=Rhamnella rubrinervis TaxID=2594499 RepID=A0A8K0MT41_9ROSA|nr:hypothetical protein FNV43_RR01577 [Rhamnella rubrinervis]
MGNEMGNNNTSGLKEEDNPAVDEAPKETAGQDNVKEDNQIVPAAEDKDFHAKNNGLVSNDPETVGDNSADKKLSNGREQEEAEAFQRAESPKILAGLNEAGGGDSEIQSAFLTKDTEHERQIESKLEEVLVETSGHRQLQKQASVKNEEGILENPDFDKLYTPHDPEPDPSIPAQLECDQHELAIIHDHPSEPNVREPLAGGEDVLGSSLACSNKENGHLIDTRAPEELEASSDASDLLVEQKAPKEGIKICEAKDGDKIENGLNGETIDEGFPAEVSVSRNEASESEAIPMANSLNPHLDVTETEDKLMVITEETRLTGKESEYGEYKHDHNPSQSCQKLMKESKPDDLNVFQSEFTVPKSKHGNYCDRKGIVCSHNDAGSKKDHVSEEAKLAEDGVLEAVCIVNQNGVSEEHCQESKEKAVIVPELGSVPAELSVTDCNDKKDFPTEKKILGEREQSAKPLPDDQSVSRVDTVQIGERSIQESKQGNIIEFLAEKTNTFVSETVQSGEQSIQELKQGNIVELLAEKANTFGSSTNMIEEVLVSMNDCGVERPRKDVTQGIETPQLAESETKISTNQPTEQCAKAEASTFAISGSETRESLERFSTDSDPDNLSVHAHMRKSPSFNLDLRSEEDRTEESDRTPLLYQDKSAIQISPSQGDVSLGSPVTHTGHDQLDFSKYQAMPVEEKVVTLERSDSEKSRTPFLGFLKEEEEAHVVVTPYKQDNHSSAKKDIKDSCKLPAKEITSTSPKVKEKRKARSSFFGTCMCCATVIN